MSYHIANCIVSYHFSLAEEYFQWQLIFLDSSENALSVPLNECLSQSWAVTRANKSIGLVINLFDNTLLITSRHCSSQWIRRLEGTTRKSWYQCYNAFWHEFDIIWRSKARVFYLNDKQYFYNYYENLVNPFCFKSVPVSNLIQALSMHTLWSLFHQF